LTASELAYIVNNSQSKVLITLQAKCAVALTALHGRPNIELCLIADGPGAGARVRNLDEATAEISFDPNS
jgi:long-chain acyl-CoA synthetase